MSDASLDRHDGEAARPGASPRGPAVSDGPSAPMAPASSPSVRALEALWFGYEAPEALAAFRIAVVTVLTVVFALHAPLVVSQFSNASDIAMPHAREAFASRSSILFYFAEPWQVQTLFLIGLAAHVLWLVGLYAFPSGLIAIFAWSSLMGRQPLLYGYPDDFGVALGFLLAWMPSSRAYSLDAKWRGRGGEVPVWCRRLLQLQIALLYVDTGLQKHGVTWTRDGTAIYFTLLNPLNRHFMLSTLWATLQPWLLRPLTYLVLIFECAFGFFLIQHATRDVASALDGPKWLRIDLRRYFLGFGVAMHLGIQMVVYVEHFSVLMIGSYLAFLAPHETAVWLQWARGRRVGVRDETQATESSKAQG